MMSEAKRCPACGAAGDNCESHFHQALFWENEYPDLTLDVHHLLVLCYYLQHPSLYSVEGLQNALGLLDDFVAKGLSPQEVRKQNAPKVDSGKRKFTVTARPDSIGSYARQPQWTMRLADVVAGEVEAYRGNIKKWAQSMHEAITLAASAR
jgi:hypothetical protein